MKNRVYILLCLCFAVLLAGCSAGKSAAGPSSDVPSAEPESASAAAYPLADAKSGIGREDTKTAQKLCCDFLDAYYHNISGETQSAADYAGNEAFQTYIEQKQQAAALKRAAEIKTMQHTAEKEEVFEDYIFIQLDSAVTYANGGETGETHQFLVQAQQGQLVIADWYMPYSKATLHLDTFRRQSGQINDPQLWYKNN